MNEFSKKSRLQINKANEIVNLVFNEMAYTPANDDPAEFRGLINVEGINLCPN
jgi:hypothetical protein